ncbi:hypothetical protein OUZ56_016298 [Daphnia magna]|uniref:Uncharacterized protein n=1 Tax=Daphnia magna TaxID=35525 RepID=A0ABR0AQ88_9CRUS|nr:hypothetical protein OUZ56_016298 [Daphnia magna]
MKKGSWDVLKSYYRHNVVFTRVGLAIKIVSLFDPQGMAVPMTTPMLNIDTAYTPVTNAHGQWRRCNRK